METRAPFGAVPTDWEVITLREACERGGGDIQTGPFGSQLHASDYVPSGVPSIMPQNIGDNRILRDGIARIREEDAERLDRYRVRRGDIVYSRRGDVGKRALVRPAEDGWLCGTGCLRVRLGNSGIDSRYAAYYLGHPDVREWILRHAVGATMPNLNTSILEALPFVVPPVPEQQSIADYLTAIEDKIEVNRRISETLGGIVRTLFTSWFVDFDPVRGTATVPEDIRRLFPDRLVDSPIGPMPEGWEGAPLSTVMTVSRDSLDPGEHPDELFEHFSLPAYDARRSAANERGTDIKSTKLRVLDGCILLSKLNPRIPRVWWPSASGSSRKIASTEFVVALPRDGVTRSYLFGLFTSAPFRGTLTSLVRGTSGSHQRVGVTDLLGIEVVVPPPGIIERFDAIVAPMFDQQEALAAESKTLAELRDTLLPKLISGEIRLPG